MKTLLTLVSALAVLALFTGLGVAQQKPATQERKVDKASPILMSAKVTRVDDKLKTFTVMVKGKEVTVNAANLKSLPKVGDIINMGRGGADPTGQRVVCAVVECDMGWGSGPCLKCFDYQPL